VPNKIPKVALLDNHDSFIHNIVHEVAMCRCEWRLFVRNQTTAKEILAYEPTHIIFGPGPGAPQDATVMMDLIQEAPPQLLMLGICLGHQALGIHFGGTVGHAPAVCHGKPDTITHTGKYIFNKVPSPTQIGRYHSLHLHSLPDCLETLATSSDGCIQAFAHKSLPVFGVQFHPESILSRQVGSIWEQFISMSPPC